MGDLEPGTEFADYTIVRLLGAGGMGAVYLAEHPRLPKQVALKLLHATLTDDDHRARFASEAAHAAKLEHPNIVGVYDRGHTDGQLWIAMQYVTGTDADSLLHQRGPLPAAQAVHIIAEVARALDFAHAAGVLHRDVKPANILLEESTSQRPGRVMLGDFGISKNLAGATRLTATGQMVASLRYAAPEQFETLDLDHRCDVYSLGCTLFQLLTGQVPYPATTLAQAWRGHALAPVPRVGRARPDLPSALDQVVEVALAKDPLQRYHSCGELAAAAYRAVHTPPPPARPGHTPAPAESIPVPSAAHSSGPRAAQVPGSSAASGPNPPPGPSAARGPGTPPAGGPAPAQHSGPVSGIGGNGIRRKRPGPVLGAVAAVVVLTVGVALGGAVLFATGVLGEDSAAGHAVENARSCLTGNTWNLTTTISPEPGGEVQYGHEMTHSFTGTIVARFQENGTGTFEYHEFELRTQYSGGWAPITNSLHGSVQFHYEVAPNPETMVTYISYSDISGSLEKREEGSGIDNTAATVSPTALAERNLSCTGNTLTLDASEFPEPDDEADLVQIFTPR